MSAMYCKPERTHRFDSESGWCAHGCGVRDDGRITNYAGHIIREGPDEYNDYRERINA